MSTKGMCCLPAGPLVQSGVAELHPSEKTEGQWGTLHSSKG